MVKDYSMTRESKKSSQNQNIESQTEVSAIADGGLITGPVLVGGAKLTWDIGKDLYI
jgi:hypothetical protein